MSDRELSLLGLRMTSTAPDAMASSATSPPLVVRVERMMTGSGWNFISFLRNVRPSIRGISMSRVMTSGWVATMRSLAT